MLSLVRRTFLVSEQSWVDATIQVSLTQQHKGMTGDGSIDIHWGLSDASSLEQTLKLSLLL